MNNKLVCEQQTALARIKEILSENSMLQQFYDHLIKNERRSTNCPTHS